MAKRKNVNGIILVIVGVLFVLLMIVLALLYILDTGQKETENITVSTPEKTPEIKTVKQVIEESGSKYIGEKNVAIPNIYVNFKYDLFDENGNSNKTFFYNLVEEVGEIEEKAFYIIDQEKSIKILAVYDEETGKYTIKINDQEDYFEKTDGKIYKNLASVDEVEYSKFILTNNLIRSIGNNSSYYANTILADKSRVDLGNGYYSYSDETILARLQSGKALNIIFKEGYDEEITTGIKATTSLKDILEKYPEATFGSLKEGYLGYITEYAYLFFYGDELSVYPYQKKENTYFDEYIVEYSNSGNLEKLASDFTTGWTSYFEKEDYNADLESFKISFPMRGILIDIKNNDSSGITIYNNYYMTSNIKGLIKSKKITLNAKDDLVDLTEQNRRESMK